MKGNIKEEVTKFSDGKTLTKRSIEPVYGEDYPLSRNGEHLLGHYFGYDSEKERHVFVAESEREEIMRALFSSERCEVRYEVSMGGRREVVGVEENLMLTEEESRYARGRIAEWNK